MQALPKGWRTARDDPNHIGELLVTLDGTDYTAQDIVHCEVQRFLMDKTAEIGNAVAAVLTLEVNKRTNIARCACVKLQYRLRLEDDCTDYISKGTFWVNTREAKGRYIVLTCYDAMLKAEQDYLTQSTTDDWPKAEADCVAEIAKRMGVDVDLRTRLAEGKAHKVDMPVGRTMRDVLKSIAAANGGNWCITNGGKLLLVPFAGTGDVLPPVTGAPDYLGMQPVTGVELTRETDTDTAVYRAGTDEGTVLSATCSYATQALAEEVLGRMRGVVYEPYLCEQRHIDPAAEAGDTVEVSGQKCTIHNLTESLGKAYYADLASPQENGELEQEYPYLTAAQRTARRLQSTIKATSEIKKTQKEITATVTETVETLDKDYTKKKEIRSIFAMSAEAVTIDTGRLTFNSNSIVINSTNFKLDEKGNITASGTFRSANNGYTAELTSGQFRLEQGGNRVLIQALPSGAGVISLMGGNYTSRMEPNALYVGKGADGVCHGAIAADSLSVKVLNGHALQTLETVIDGYTVGLPVYYMTKLASYSVADREVSVYDADDNPYQWVYSEVNYTETFETNKGTTVVYTAAAWMSLVATCVYSQSTVVTVTIYNVKTDAVLKQDIVECSGNYSNTDYYTAREFSYSFREATTARISVQVSARQENSYEAAYGTSYGRVTNITVYP